MKTIPRRGRHGTLLLAGALALAALCGGSAAFAEDARPAAPAATASPAPPAASSTKVADAAATATQQVTIDNFAFTPAMLTVKPGTTVTFINHDDIPHSIVNATGKFRSKALDSDQSYQFTFNDAGDYDYFCGLHPHMKGKIIVAP